MKIDKYNIFLRENNYLDDELDEDTWYNDDNSEDMENLLYLIRKMFINSGIDKINTYSRNMDITILIDIREKEKLRDIIKIFEIVNKLRKDMLAQYDSEFELWKTKSGKPFLNFSFYYLEGIDDDNIAF
jgi:hypothetical protein